MVYNVTRYFGREEMGAHFDTGYRTLGQTATDHRAQLWHVSRLADRGLIPTARIGKNRVVRLEDYPLVEAALVEADYIKSETTSDWDEPSPSWLKRPRQGSRGMCLAEADLWDPDRLRLPTAAGGLPRHGEAFLRGPIPFDWLATASQVPGAALHVGLALRFLRGRFERGRDRRGTRRG
jgi:hypothetical protein